MQTLDKGGGRMSNTGSILKLLFTMHMSCTNKVSCRDLANNSGKLIKAINSIDNEELKQEILDELDKYEDAYSVYSTSYHQSFFETGFKNAVQLFIECANSNLDISKILDNL